MRNLTQAEVFIVALLISLAILSMTFKMEDKSGPVESGVSGL